MPRPFKYSKDQNPVYSIEISQSPVPARNRGTLDIINQELTITVLNSRDARKKELYGATRLHVTHILLQSSPPRKHGILRCRCHEVLLALFRCLHNRIFTA
jgi:hypothetical protein